MSTIARALFSTLGVASTIAASAGAAHAQSSDTLPSLDESSVVVPGEPAPAPAPPVVVLRAPSRKLPLAAPVRARRRLALLGEVGWNGLAGFGPTLAYHLDPHFSVDLGAGLSLLGWKFGVRARYNFLTGPVTPFIGAGIIGASGFGDSPLSINENDPDPTREKVNIKVLPSTWLQTVGGVDWIAPSGFNLIGTLGYAFLATKDPVQLVTGTPNAEERKAFDVLFRSNVVLSVALGYSFR